MTKPLCPACGNGRVQVSARITAQYEVMHDCDLDDLIVLGETLGDAEWDEKSRVRCSSCGWRGALGDIQSLPQE